MANPSTNHGIPKPDKGTDPWDQDYYDFVETVDDDLKLSDTLANRPDPASVTDGAWFEATDTGIIYRKDSTSSEWEAVGGVGTPSEPTHFINVRNYGARGEDNDNDETSEIQAALSDAQAIRAPLYFPSGRYYFNQKLELRKLGGGIIGDGPRATILKYGGTEREAILAVEDWQYCRDFHLQSDSNTNNKHGISTDHENEPRAAQRSTWKNIRITGFNNADAVGFNLEGQTWIHIIRNVSSQYNHQGMQLGDPNQNGVVNAIFLDRCYINNNDNGGVRFSHGNGVTMVGCEIEANNGWGLKKVSSYAEGLGFYGGYFEQNEPPILMENTTAFYLSPDYINSHDHEAIVIDGSDKGIIQTGRIFNGAAGDPAVRLGGANGPAQDITIRENGIDSDISTKVENNDTRNCVYETPEYYRHMDTSEGVDMKRYRRPRTSEPHAPSGSNDMYIDLSESPPRWRIDEEGEGRWRKMSGTLG